MSYKLILIEDDEIFTYLLEKSIKKIGLLEPTATFPNGEKACNYFKTKYCKEDNYVIFLDINMPVMNGRECLNILSTFMEASNCLLFILTSSRNLSDIDAFQANPLVSKYITKPIGDAELKSLKDLIEEKFGEPTSN